MSESDFVVIGWEVRHSYDVPNHLELTAEVLCRGIDRHHPHPSKEDIGRAFGLLLGVDPERVRVR